MSPSGNMYDFESSMDGVKLPVRFQHFRYKDAEQHHTIEVMSRGAKLKDAARIIIDDERYKQNKIEDVNFYDGWTNLNRNMYITKAIEPLEDGEFITGI